MYARNRISFLLCSALLAGLILMPGVSWLVRQSFYPDPGRQPGLLLQYFSNPKLAGPASYQRAEQRTSWEGASLSPQRANDYSLRLTGLLYITVPGYYELGTASDDDSWLFLDGKSLVDNHGEHPLQRRMSGVWLAPGPHLFWVEYVQRRGNAVLQLYWRPFWSREPSLLPPGTLRPVAQALDYANMLELGHAVHIRQAQAAAVLLTTWLLLVAGLLPPGGWRRVLTLYLATAPFVILSILPQLSQDLWCDEIVSLTLFSVQPLAVTVGAYPFANNHIFYNVINNLFLQLIGSHDLHQVVMSPFALRLLSLGFTIGALAWLYRAMLRRFSGEAAWLATLVLATTLPVASFATQLRGYSLCLLLTVIMLDLLLRFIDRPKAFTGLGLALANGALVWVLPTNVYFCAAVLLAMTPLLRQPEKRRQVLSAMAWVAGGMVLGALLYLPVRDQVLKQGSVMGFFSQAKIVFSLMPTVWEHLLTGRYLLLPALMLGAWLLMKKKAKGGGSALAAASLLVLPFLLLWAYGTDTYQRVFLMLAVPGAGAAGLLLSAPLKAWSWGKAGRWAWLGMVFAICVGSYAWSLTYWRNQAEAAYSSGHYVQNLSYGYYLHHFNPRQTLLRVRKASRCLPSGHFILGVGLQDGGALFDYGMHFGLELLDDIDRARSIISQSGCLYVITRGRPKPPGLHLEALAPLKPLDRGAQFYHLYRWGPAEVLHSHYDDDSD